MERTDRKIDIQALKDGDSKAYYQLTQIYGEKALRIAYFYTGNQDEAHDIVQETLLKVFQRIESFRNERPFAPWFFRILVNTCRDWKRNFFRRFRRPLEEIDSIPGWASPATPSITGWIRRQIQKMPPRMRMVFILHYQEDFSVTEISEILNISQNTVRVQLMKGRRFLREYFEKHRGEINHDL